MEPIRGLPQLDLDNLALLNDYWNNGPVSLTANGDITSLPAWLLGETPDESGKLHNATSCVVITVDRGSEDLDAFYFYFYSYDQGANITQVLPPMNGLIEDTEHGMHFGDHVGDWEHNMIRFHDGKPTGIYYSQHSSGSAYKWDDKALSVENGRVRDPPDLLTDFDHAANIVSAHSLQRMGFSRELGISWVKFGILFPQHITTISIPKRRY
ncbi:hypothetical protein Landi51_07098 [Colletotrichum acutatum]